MPSTRSAAPGDPGISPPNLRANCARALVQVVEYRHTIDWILQNQENWLATPLAQELVYGSLRHYFSLREKVQEYLDKPLRKKDKDVFYLLLVGAYQLIELDLPHHAILNETVSACKVLRKPWAKGLVNAVLRKIQQNLEDNKTANVSDHGPDDYNPDNDHSAWLADLLRQQYPNSWQNLLAANNQRAPMSLRVNSTLMDSAQYSSQLEAAGHPHTATTAVLSLESPSLDADSATFHMQYSSICLKQPCRATELPGWSEGHVAIQDFGAQLAGCISESAIRSLPEASATPSATTSRSRTPENTPRILDACCAPGGKLFHLWEKLNDHVLTKASKVDPDSSPDSNNDTSFQAKHPNQHRHSLLGLELSQTRAQHTQEQATRLGHKLDIQIADATNLEWWDGQPFDLICIDAPCSGTGTLRRHPDIKVLLEQSSIEQHAHTQLLLLRNLWQTLAPGGKLLYSTCSLLEAENDGVIDTFLKSFEPSNAIVNKISLNSGNATKFGWQLTPIDPNTDGFYYALLQKE